MKKYAIKCVLLLALICILSIIFPKTGVNIQADYSKDEVPAASSFGEKYYKTEPFPFINTEKYTFAIRVSGIPDHISSRDDSLFSPNGEVEFYSSNLLYSQIKAAKLPAEKVKDIDLLTLRKQGIQKTYYHFSLIPLVLLMLALPYLYKSLKIAAAQPQGYWFFACFLTWLAMQFWAATFLPYYHGSDAWRHFFSGAWYFNHILPISLDDKYFIEPVWGMNYAISSADWGYLFSFKLAAILDYFLNSPLVINVRYAQIIISAAIVLITVYFVGFWQAFLVLTIYSIVPQSTYINLYTTLDSYAFIAAIFALLYGRYGKQKILTRTCIAIIILLNTRQHYLLCLLPLAYFYLEEKKYNIKAIIKDTPWIFAAFAIGSYKILYMHWDQWQHHTTYLQVSMAHANEVVGKSYTKLINNTIEYDMFFYMPWYITTLLSFFGVFGQTRCVMPLGNFAICCALFLYLNTHVKAKDGFVLIIVLLVNIVLSLLMSAGYSYEPQGRYIFPFLATVPAMLYNYNTRLKIIFPVGIIIAAMFVFDFTNTPQAQRGMDIVLHGEVASWKTLEPPNYCFAGKAK
ncbi:MAG: hypothetical protein WCL30_01250 [Pseudomonadota bacterium]